MDTLKPIAVWEDIVFESEPREPKQIRTTLSHQCQVSAAKTHVPEMNPHQFFLHVFPVSTILRRTDSQPCIQY